MTASTRRHVKRVWTRRAALLVRARMGGDGLSMQLYFTPPMRRGNGGYIDRWQAGARVALPTSAVQNESTKDGVSPLREGFPLVSR